MPLICLSCFYLYVLSIVTLLISTMTHYHLDIIFWSWISLWKKQNANSGHRVKLKLDWSIWRIGRGDLWSEDSALSFILTHTLITHLGTSYALFGSLAAPCLRTCHITTCGGNPQNTDSSISTSRYTKFFPSISVSPSLPNKVVVVG